MQDNQEALPPPLSAAEGTTSRTWIQTGFFFSLGAVLLAILAELIFWFSRATLAMITPFVVGLVFALLLDPLVDRLESRKMSRPVAAGLVFAVFLLVLIGVATLAIPALIHQATQLAENGPKNIETLQANTDMYLAHHRRILGIPLPENVKAISAEASTRASDMLSNSAGKVTGFLVGSLTLVFDGIIALITMLYLLMDLDRLTARLFYLLPAKSRGMFDSVAREIGRVFSNYLRGLLTVSALYGVGTLVLLLGLSAVHPGLLQYALIVAVAGGLLYTVPYIGPFITAFITFLIAFSAGGMNFGLVAVLLTLIMNQVYDNIVTPRLVGGGVGLHPIAALFALTFGGSVFGVWGMLLSVPIAASIQVILYRLFPKLTTPTPQSFIDAQEAPAYASPAPAALTDLPSTTGDAKGNGK